MMIEERFLLAKERIQEIKNENILQEGFNLYFVKVAEFLDMICDTWDFVKADGLKAAPIEELRERNYKLYEDILEEQYGHSYANPEYSVLLFGEAYGRFLAFLYAEMRSLIPLVYERRLADMVIRLELFLEVYGSFCCAQEENQAAPDVEALSQIAYWYVSDYARDAAKKKLEDMLDRKSDFALHIIEGDLSDPRYLYYFGEYITDNEIETYRHLQGLPEETLQKMADTYTEGYRIGFITGNKDITKKKTVSIRYILGFEPMIKKAVVNFREMGLDATIYRAPSSILEGRGMNRLG